MTPHKLVQMAQDLCRTSDRDLQAAIDRVQRSLTPEERLALKIEVAMQADGGLATDVSQWNPQDPYQHSPQSYDEIDRKLLTAGFQRGRAYTVQEADDLLKKSPWANDVEVRIGCKARLQALGVLRDERGTWSDPRQQRAAAAIHLGRMHASADERPRGAILRGRDGEPITLRSCPE
jgi:hypothetical protein